MWGILNTDKTGVRLNEYPNHFITSGSEEYDKDGVANSFNLFFVNMGPDLIEAST